MTINPTSPMTEEDVLLAFTAEPNHGRATLEDYVRRYPLHAEAIAALAVELMLAPERDQSRCAPADPAVDRAWQTFSAAAVPLETKSLATSDAVWGSLSQSAFRDLASRLDVTTLFLKLLRDRAITYSQIPARLIERVAEELHSTFAAVAADLQRPPMVAAGERFKSDNKPAPQKQISFEEAIALAHLSPQQQQKLLTLME